MGMRRLGLGGALSVALLAGAATAPMATAADTTAVRGSDTSADSGAVSIDPRLEDALATATDPLQVVVTFDGEGAPTSADVALLSDIGITTGRTFHSLPIVGILATADQVAALEEQPEVRSLYLNREVDYELDDYTALTGVDDVRTDRKLTAGNGGLPVTGDGVGVVVNDSGVDGTHADLMYDDHLVQNVAAQTNLNALDPTLLPVTWVEDVPNTDSTGGHGTHVAGIVGATGERSGGKYEGVAPGADLVGYGSGAGLLLLDVLGGFDYALTHQVEYDIRVITNSWGTTSDRCTDVDPDDPVNVATKDAYDRNIVVVFSAGNSGPDECTITGNYKKAPWVMAELAEFSSLGTEGNGGSFTVDGERWKWEDQPTLTAPGVDVVSTRTASPVGTIGAPKDLELIDPAHLPFYTTLSGTSMAAPHAAGVVALMLEVDPTLTPLEVKSILEQTATDMPGYKEWEVGAGYIDAYDAVKRAAR
jgi:serine protease AprX